MTQEIDWQRKLIDNVKAHGGHGHKWSSAYTVGVPDLILSHGLLDGTLVTEVKLEKNLPTQFDRKLKITPKQKEEMIRFHHSGTPVCVIAVLHKNNSNVWVVPLRHPRTMTDDVRVNDEMLKDEYKWKKSTFDLSRVLSEFFVRGRLT